MASDHRFARRAFSPRVTCSLTCAASAAGDAEAVGAPGVASLPGGAPRARRESTNAERKMARDGRSMKGGRAYVRETAVATPARGHLYGGLLAFLHRLARTFQAGSVEGHLTGGPPSCLEQEQRAGRPREARGHTVTGRRHRSDAPRLLLQLLGIAPACACRGHSLPKRGTFSAGDIHRRDVQHGYC